MQFVFEDADPVQSMSSSQIKMNIETMEYTTSSKMADQNDDFL